MAGVGDQRGAVGREAKHEAGGEAIVEAAVEPAIEMTQHFGGTGGEFGQGAEGADDEGDGHGGGKSLAADVADDDEGGAAGKGDDLEEVAADFRGRAVAVGDGEAGDDGRGVGHEDLLDFAGRFQLHVDPALTAPLKEMVMSDGEKQGEEEDYVENEARIECVACDVEMQEVEIVRKRPMRKAHTLPGDSRDDVPCAIEKDRGGKRPERTPAAAGQANRGDDEDEEGSEAVNGGGRCIEPGQDRAAVAPEEDDGDVHCLGREVESGQDDRPAAPSRLFSETKEVEQDQPERDVGDGVLNLNQ